MFRILIAIVLAGGGAYALQAFVQPELAEVKRIQAERAVVEDAISKAREVIRLRDELLARYNSIDPAAIDKIRKFLPAGSALSQLFIDIDTMASQSGVIISSIAFTESEPAPASLPEVGNALSITLKVDGTYDQFRAFLGLIEKNLRLIDVVSISLVGKTEEVAGIGFEVKLRAYYQERTIL